MILIKFDEKNFNENLWLSNDLLWDDGSGPNAKWTKLKDVTKLIVKLSSCSDRFAPYLTLQLKYKVLMTRKKSKSDEKIKEKRKMVDWIEFDKNEYMQLKRKNMPLQKSDWKESLPQIEFLAFNSFKNWAQKSLKINNKYNWKNE